ncbi:MAG: hypothetical protein Kow0074_23730 [Candidatus Zixiibacteriota bacterium]
MRFRFTAFSTVLLLIGQFVFGFGAVPRTINVQGRLTDALGAPLPPGDKGFQFKIFDTGTGGTQLWPAGSGEVQVIGSDADGLWNATIGTVFPIPDSIFADSVRWLEISVSDLVNPPETLPRIRFHTVPYAFAADRVTSIDGATGGVIVSKVSIGPGHTNTGTDAFVAGADNTATGDYASIAGGENNAATGAHAVIPGGQSNEAHGDFSVAAGFRAKANHEGSFVWGDFTPADIATTGPNQFLIRANGGVGIGTNLPIGMLHVASNIFSSGYFTSSRRDPDTKVIRADYTGLPADARAVSGTSAPDDYWGIGGEFTGGFVGAQGIVNPTGSNSYYGIRGLVIGGTGNAYACAGTASGGGVNYAVYGQASGGTDNWGGYFIGDVNVTGTLSKGAGSFKIDHPLDPENKYLYHSFVESPDMMNVYNGNITTDTDGVAIVTLPDYFEALNRDFRYQLTVIGQFAQAIVAEEITGNQFAIRTDKPNVKVSWQVTGIRRDAYANAHRIPVEEDKPFAERGLYKYPEAFGKPASEGVEFRQQKMLEEKVRTTTTK